MGTWGTGISSNDTFSDIYADFFDLYNSGDNPRDIYEKLISQNQEILENSDDSNNFWFALSLALWETKSLDPTIYNRVKTIIESENDLKIWRELDATESDIKKRKIVLDKFLEKISVEKPKPKSRKKKKSKEAIFEKGTCLTFKLRNGNYGGAIVLESEIETGYGYNLIVSTRINQPNKPTLKDFEKAKVLVANFGNWNNQAKITWYLPDQFQKQYSELFEIVGNLKVDRDFSILKNDIKASSSAGWQHIIESVNNQFQYEEENAETKSFKISELIGKKWWQF